MKKSLTLLALLCALLTAHGATQPTVSTADTTIWYMVQFLNGENVLTAGSDGDDVTVQVPTGKDSQWWKITGSSTTGYTFTSKTGLILTNTTGAMNGMFQASSTATDNILYTLSTSTNTTYSGEWVICPQTNTSVYMNQWGGAATGASLGLWNDRSDGNQPLQFVSEVDWSSVGQPLPLIPYPQSVTRGEGTLSVSALQKVSAADTNAIHAVETFIEDLARVSGQDQLPVVEGETGGTGITLTLNETLADEGYTLSITQEGITIEAKAYAGFFYALQTLRQLLPAAIYGDDVADDFDTWTLPVVDIADEPLMEWRGFHFDVSRHFFTIDEVKKLLRTASQYKFNRFHWHLTDDQGWRVEIPEYPLLTEIGSIRKSSFTLLSYGGSAYYDDTEYGYGCYYTLDQLRDMVDYAKELNIEIMPEIDLPGHMVSDLAAFPELSCDPTKTYEVRVESGISSDVLNIGKDESIDFLKCVLGHIAEVFPYQYIHLGGDECPTTSWASNAECLQRVADEGLSGVDELQSWLVELLGTWLKDEYDKDIMVWDELLDHWSSDNTVKPVIMAWNSEGTDARQAYAKGMRSIHVPYSKLYLDFQQAEADDKFIDEPYNGGWGASWVNTVPEIYGFNPLVNMTDVPEYMMGAQGNLWTETCSSLLQAEYCYFPRLLALSEINWLPTDNKPGWVSFYQRLQTNVKALDVQGVTYAKHYIEAEDLTEDESIRQEAELMLSATQPGEAGYPGQEAYDQLEASLSGTTAEISTALEAFKSSELTQPEEGAIYRIISAATASDQRYKGSSVYAKDTQMAMHYTAQAEAEEMWTFVPQGDSTYIVRHATNGLELTMTSGTTEVTLTTEGTPIELIPAAANAPYSYSPGVICIKAADGNTDTRLLTGQNSGILLAGTDDKICMPGTWTLELVEDYYEFLLRLLYKGERTLDTATPGEVGQPTQEALDYLEHELVTPLEALVQSQTTATRETFDTYQAIYEKFLAMPTTTMLETLSEDYYYRIRSVYFSNYYACLNTTTRQVQPKTLADTDNYLWYIHKNDNGTVTIYNKAYDDYCASVNSVRADQVVRTNSTYYEWTLTLQATDTSNEGIAIVESSGTYSWYTNPSAYSNVILKPVDWGGSVWTFEQTDESIPTAVDDLQAEESVQDTDHKTYDLSGRQVRDDYRGVVIRDGRVIKQ